MRRENRDHFLVAWALVIAVGAACSANNPPGNTSPTDAGADGTGPATQRTVGPAGATINTPEGVSIEIPAGALPSDTAITITSTPAAVPPENADWASTPYTFGPEGTHFLAPITITLPFTLPEGAKTSQVGIAVAHDGSDNYVALETRIVDDTHIQTVTSHFSKYGTYLSKCKFTSDCALGFICEGNYCEHDTGIHLCQHDIDCAGGRTCTRYGCSLYCVTNDDCKSMPGNVCKQNTCDVQYCRLTTDCPIGSLCDYGYCVSNGLQLEFCGPNGDCPSGKVCTGAFCVPACRGNSDCTEGSYCQGGACKSDFCKVNSDCPAGSACDGGYCQKGSTLWCKADSDCSGGMSCVKGSYVSACQMKCTRENVGSKCMPWQTCENQLCATPYCKNNTECPNGSSCLSYGWCGSTSCKEDSQCAAGQACITGYCQYAQVTSSSTDGGVPEGGGGKSNGISSINCPKGFGILSTGGSCLMQLAGGGNPISIAVAGHAMYWVNGLTTINAGDVVLSTSGPTDVYQMPIGGGPLTTLATGQNTPMAITVDEAGGSLYWVNAGVLVPTGGGDAGTSYTVGNSVPKGASAVTYCLYAPNAQWGNCHSNANAGSVMKMPISGGAPTVIASGRNMPRAIAVDDNNLYWVDQGLPTAFGSACAANGAIVQNGAVLQMSKKTGVITTLASGQNGPMAIAIDDKFVYWTNYGKFVEVTNFALCESRTVCQGTVMKVPIGGGSVSTLTTLQNYCGTSLGRSIDALYWGTEWDQVTAQGTLGSATLMKVPDDGGAAVIMEKALSPNVFSAADDTNVFFSTPYAGNNYQPVMKTPIGTGTSTVLSVGQNVTSMAVDRNSLYWVTGQSGAVMQLTPK